MIRRRFSLLVLAAIVLLTLAACGGGSGNGGGNGSGESTARDPSTIKVASSPLGKILVDGNGRTLYLFTVDGNNATSSKCDAACLRVWPALTGKPKAGDGVDAKSIGTTGGGTPQATYAGHPLYYYAKDKSAGDVTGQGVGKVWYVLDAKGTEITKPVPAGNAGGQGGY